MTRQRFRRIFDWVSWLALGGVVVYFAVTSFKAPSPANAPASQVQLLNGQTRSLSDESEKLVIVFWATWCPPCRVELARVNRLVESHPEWAEKIVAVSLGEDLKTVAATAAERGYRFQVAYDEAAESGQKFEIQGTPTVLFKETGNRVSWRATGISPSLELRMKKFLAP